MYQFKLPDLGEGVAEGEVTEWLVEVGQDVQADQPLVEILTDKATVEIPSPVSGTVSAIRVAEGETVPVETVLIDIDTGAAGAARSEPSEPGNGPLALPAVRRLAGDLGVDLTTVRGTGPEGRITEQDVRAAAEGGGADTHAEGVPLRGTRRQIARHLEAAAAVPTVTNVDAADFSAVRAAQVSPLTAVSQACVRALQDHPKLNQWLVDGERLVQHDEVHLGIATQTEDGLVVPVIRNAHTMGINDLEAEVTRVAEAARAASLDPEELRGSTITLTSAGLLAGQFATPLLNVPEVAILGLYRIEERPVIRDGEFVARPIGNLSITFDHRALDGRDAARFLAQIIELLEGWDGQNRS